MKRDHLAGVAQAPDTPFVFNLARQAALAVMTTRHGTRTRG